MRVLFVYRYLTVGGCETVLRARMQALKERGHDARAWFFLDLGGRTVFSDMTDSIFVGDEAAFRAAWGFKNWNLISTLDCEDVVEYLRGESSRPPLAVECHSSYPKTLTYLEKIRPEDIVAFCAPSEHHARTVKQLIHFESPIRVLPNPLHPSFLGDLAPVGAVPSRPLVAWIGRLDEHKNWRGFLELGHSLVKRGAKIELLVVARPGEDATADDLFSLAKKMGVLPILRWIRGVPHQRIPTLLDVIRASGGLAVCTSRAESFGLAVAEAMARGCCPVAPDMGPFTEFIENGTSGILFPETDYEQAATSVLEVLNAPKRVEKLGAAARQSVLGRFSRRPPWTLLNGSFWSLGGEEIPGGNSFRGERSGCPALRYPVTVSPSPWPGTARRTASGFPQATCR